jgi:hypothetical protein
LRDLFIVQGLSYFKISQHFGYRGSHQAKTTLGLLGFVEESSGERSQLSLPVRWFETAYLKDKIKRTKQEAREEKQRQIVARDSERRQAKEQRAYCRAILISQRAAQWKAQQEAQRQLKQAQREVAKNEKLLAKEAQRQLKQAQREVAKNERIRLLAVERDQRKAVRYQQKLQRIHEKEQRSLAWKKHLAVRDKTHIIFRKRVQQLECERRQTQSQNAKLIWAARKAGVDWSEIPRLRQGKLQPILNQLWDQSMAEVLAQEPLCQ